MEEKLPRDQSLPSLGWEPQAYIPCIHCQCKMWWVFFGLDIGGSKVKNLPAMQEAQELQVRSLGLEDPMEEGMATHSRILAWRISWTEEPGGLQSMGSLESDTTERLHFDFSLSCTGEGNGNPLQCSCLENSRDWGAWWAAVYGVAQSWTRLKWLSSSSSSKTCV